MTTAMLFPDVFQRGTLTQPTFVCKLLLTALLILYAMRYVIAYQTNMMMMVQNLKILKVLALTEICFFFSAIANCVTVCMV